MPTHHVQQTWRAKRPKTVVSHDVENPSQPPRNEFATGCSKSDSILKLEHFLKPCVLCDYKEKEKTTLFEVIWSLGATSNFTQFYFKVENKIKFWTTFYYRNEYPTIISTYNILRLTFKVCCLMCTSWSSVTKCIRRLCRWMSLCSRVVASLNIATTESGIKICPNIPRPFPVAHTQIVERVLLLNLKLYTVLVLMWFSGVAD